MRFEDPKIVSKVLGQKDVAITLERYRYALPMLHRKATARVDALLAHERTGGHEGSQ